MCFLLQAFAPLLPAIMEDPAQSTVYPAFSANICNAVALPSAQPAGHPHMSTGPEMYDADDAAESSRRLRRRLQVESPDTQTVESDVDA